MIAPDPPHEMAKATNRIADGRSLRAKLPRRSHSKFAISCDRDVIAMLERSNDRRIPDLVPVRYWRMSESPFAFFRGAANVMAFDLATGTRDVGLTVQACGDCHVANFGTFATPERNVIFDINDFDETHSAPWEWDLKRLVASSYIVGRECGLSEKD